MIITGSMVEELPEELSIRFQPIFELVDGRPARLHAVECLSRGRPGTALESAAALFAAVRQAGETGPVDRLCIATALGFELGQGYLWSPPLPPAELCASGALRR